VKALVNKQVLSLDLKTQQRVADRNVKRGISSVPAVMRMGMVWYVSSGTLNSTIPYQWYGIGLVEFNVPLDTE